MIPSYVKAKADELLSRRQYEPPSRHLELYASRFECGDIAPPDSREFPMCYQYYNFLGSWARDQGVDVGGVFERASYSYLCYLYYYSKYPWKFKMEAE